MSVGLIKRSIVVLFIACGLLLLASRSSATGAAAEGQEASSPPKPAGAPAQLAEDRFKNIQIFKGQPAPGVMRAMMFFTKSLGVDCAFCHVQGAMEKDDNPHKGVARDMYRMVQFANKAIGEPKVSCYTCHAGHNEPEPPPDLSREKVEEMFKKGAAENSKPAETVYKNIQVLKGQPAGTVMVAMQLMTKELGVKCNFCHVMGAFEKDDNPHKNTARQMFGMMMGIAKEFTKGEVVINCYTCHKGKPEPVSFPPQEAKPEEKKPEPNPVVKPGEKVPPL